MHLELMTSQTIQRTGNRALGRVQMQKIIAGLIVLFSMGVALIAFAAEKPTEKSCAKTEHACLYKQGMDAGDYGKALGRVRKAAG